MCCNGKKWVLQKASLKIFEAILTPTSSIATYFISVMLPGTKNIAQKNDIKTLKRLVLYGWANNQPPRSFRKGSSDPMCCIFHVFKSAEAQECCLPISHAPLAPTETHVPPLPAISLVGRRAKPKQCGMSGPVPAGSCWAHPGGVVVPLFTATAQRCAAAPAWSGTQSTHVLSVELHISHWLPGIFFIFLSTLATGNEEWTDLKDDCTGCLFQNNFPKHAMKSEW